jgi:hypothetical protein
MKRFLSLTAYHAVFPDRCDDWKSPVPASMKRRDARIWQLAYAAAVPVVNKFGARPPRSIIVGTALGALEETRQFLEGVFTDGFGSPRNFISSVHNSIAGKLALEFKVRGPNLTLCDGHNSLASAITAADLLTDVDFPALICIIDERITLLDELRPHFSNRCCHYLADNWEEAAVAFMVDDSGETGIPLRAFGPVCTRQRNPETACRTLITQAVPDFSGKFLFGESTTSFVQPAVTAASVLENSGVHTIIGSFSPTSGAVALVEIAPAS